MQIRIVKFLPRFSVSPRQATAYLFGVALFSISFLVFLNSSISFVVTDVIGQKEAVGDAVGTLGFADELLALVACPLWGIVSDRLGVRSVVVAGYLLIGLSLICLVQSTRIYPDLLIFRLLFSLGGAACSTMVTAILPAMVAKKQAEAAGEQSDEAPRQRIPRAQSDGNVNRNSLALSFSSELTITPARYESRSNSQPQLSRQERRQLSPTPETSEDEHDPRTETSQLAGFVGMFTGLGALVALLIFLPLPAKLGNNTTKAKAVQESFYIVAAVAVVVALFVFWGLNGLPGEEHKGVRNLFSLNKPAAPKEGANGTIESDQRSIALPTYPQLIKSAILLGFTDPHIFIGYLGGFVARASSVGISLFIPLFVNAYFIRRGLCDSDGSAIMKENCKRAYTVASMLTGISQLVALLSAPLFGYFNARMARRRYLSTLPLALGAVCGLVGCVAFGVLEAPDPFSGEPGGKGAILAVILVGIGQIAAIVCSLGILSRGIHAPTCPTSSSTKMSDVDGSSSFPVEPAETAPLLASQSTLVSTPKHERDTTIDRSQLKGSIAGVYSLAGGAGILLLTKLGGYLFDRAATGAPFFMLAGFNAILLVAIVGVAVGTRVNRTRTAGQRYEAGDERDDEAGA